MLPRKYRATGSEIRTMRQQKASVYHSPHLTLAVTSLPGVSASKGTCTISRRVAAKATERNTFKRRCREALRQTGFPWVGAQPHLFLIRAKKDAHTLPFKTLVQEIETLKERAVAY